MHTKVSRQILIKLLKAKNYELITEGEIKSTTRFVVRCPAHNYTWESCYGNFKYRDGKCIFCRSRLPSIKEVDDFISSKNGVLLGSKVKNGITWYKIQCNIHSDHTWDARWRYLTKRNSWCKFCSWDRQTIQHDEIKEEVEKRNGTLISENCSGSLSHFDVKCNKDNFIFSTTWSMITTGSWCPKCAKLVPHTYDEINTLVKERGGILLKFAKTVREKLEIQCSCGNIFTPELSNFLKGTWCTACSKRKQTQTKLFNIIKDIFNNKEVKYDQRPFDWLRDKEKLELDIWIPQIKLAIEYDGKQHFKAVSLYGGEESLKITQARDKLKNKLISEHPQEIIYFIRFSYKDKITKEFVLEKLKEYNILL